MCSRHGEGEAPGEGREEEDVPEDSSMDVSEGPAADEGRDGGFPDDDTEKDY